MKQKQIDAIVSNEACQICGKNVIQKCIICLINNQTAGYCTRHHFEKNHVPLWISAFE